jgi:hypothetical protein
MILEIMTKISENAISLQQKVPFRNRRETTGWQNRIEAILSL